MPQATLFDRLNPDADPAERVPFAKGSHSSWKAAQRVDPRQRRTRTDAYLHLLADRGATIDETAAQLLRCKQSSICSVRWLCSRPMRGWIQKAGEQIAPQTGESCTAWALTAEGRRRVEDAR